MRALIALLFSLGFLLGWTQEVKPHAEKSHELGLEAMRSKNLPEALVHFNRAIAESPGYAEAYASRARLKQLTNDSRGALMDFTLSLELVSDNYEVLFSRAILRYQLGYYVFAREDFTKLLTMTPGETNSIYYRRSAHSPGTDKILTAQGSIKPQLLNYLGLIELELNNCLIAIAYLDSAIQLQPDEADYYVNRALAKQDCDQKEAVDDLKSALSLEPDHSMARHNLAMTAARQGAYGLAIQELSSIIDSDTLLIEPYLERGYYRMLQRDYAGALSDYSRALKLDSSDPDTWLNRGMVNEKLKHWKEAYSDFTTAIELKPDYAKAWLNRGNVSAARYTYILAIEDYSIALMYQPDYSAAYFNRALAYYKTGRKKEACLDINQAMAHGMIVEKAIKESICGVR
jgi:tetratricopeptide (TPR) repeat protein